MGKHEAIVVDDLVDHSVLGKALDTMLPRQFGVCSAAAGIDKDGLQSRGECPRCRHVDRLAAGPGDPLAYGVAMDQARQPEAVASIKAMGIISLKLHRAKTSASR